MSVDEGTTATADVTSEGPTQQDLDNLSEALRKERVRAGDFEKELKESRRSGDQDGNEAREKTRQLEEQVKALESGVDNEKVRELATEMGKADADQAAANLKAKTDALDETKESLITLADKHESLLYETKATPLLLSKEKIGVRPDALEEALEQVHKHFEFKDGDFVLRDATTHKLLRDKEGDPVGLDGFGPFLREIKPFYFDALSGAGSQASDTRAGSNGTMTAEEAGKLSMPEFKKARAAGLIHR